MHKIYTLAAAISSLHCMYACTYVVAIGNVLILNDQCFYVATDVPLKAT